MSLLKETRSTGDTNFLKQFFLVVLAKILEIVG